MHSHADHTPSEQVHSHADHAPTEQVHSHDDYAPTEQSHSHAGVLLKRGSIKQKRRRDTPDLPPSEQKQPEIKHTRKDKTKYYDWRDYQPDKHEKDYYSDCTMIEGDTPHLDTPDYQAMSAKCKLENIWRLCLIDERRERFYTGWEFESLFHQDMNLSYDSVTDTMPEGRLKKTHPVGLVAKIEFIAAEDTPYTGIFRGAKHGIMRISETTAVTPEVPKTAPGFGIKFLRDGMYSANSVAMFSFDG